MVTPLTHHEIIALIAPFSRRGRHVDLAASARLDRRIVFKPREHAGIPTPRSQLRESFSLQDLGYGTFRLTRHAGLAAAGLEATLEAEGSDLESLLARIEAVPLARQCRCVEGLEVAVSHRLAPAGAAEPLVFDHATARLGGFRITLAVGSLRNEPAKVELLPDAAQSPALPDDVLAVLGRAWTPLKRVGDPWVGRYRLPRNEPRRSRSAEAGFDSGAQHLARLLAEPPAQYHDRWLLARWRVFLRRLLPLAGCAGLIGAAAAVPKLHLADSSGLRMLIFNSPPLLMMLFFCMRELPTIELPPLPRRPAEPGWGAGTAAEAR